MSDFKPGWYKVGAPDSNGNTTLLYFSDPNTVIAECYTTSDGRQIYVNGEDYSKRWSDDYAFAGIDPNGQWDNKAKAAEADGGKGNRTAKSGSGGKTPCEDASLICEICNQKGFPILPLRYAVARSDVQPKAPKLQAPFGKGVQDIALPTDSAQYTLRLLRPGYLYAFNEKRGEWKGYVVSDGGFLLEYDMESVVPPNIGDAKPCARMAASAAARCVMVPDAEKAGKVWLGFSDTAWTKAVWDKNRKEAYREHHMQCVDVAGWLTGATQQDHAAAIDKIVSLVSEFAQPLPSGQYEAPNIVPPLLTELNDIFRRHSYPAFAHSPQLLFNAGGSSHDLIESTAKVVEHLPNQGPAMMLALHDPAGIGSELNELVKLRALEWAEEPARKRKHESALMIGTVRQAVEHGGVRQESEERKRTMGLLAGIMPATVGAALGGEPNIRGAGRAIQRAGRIRESELAAIHADAWDEYEDMYDEPARQKYLNEEYPAALAAFEKATLKPLDATYLAWLQNDLFRYHFICNYDRDDCDSGMGYTGALYQALLDAAGRKTVCDYLDNCLLADPVVGDPLQTTAMQVLQRGLVLNQDDLATQWNVAAKTYTPEGGWDDMASQLYGAFRAKLATALTGALEARLKDLSAYSYEFSGAFIRRLQVVYQPATGEVIATIAERRVVTLLGLLGKTGASKFKLVEVSTRVNRMQASRILANATEAAVEGAKVRNSAESLRDLFDPVERSRINYRGILLLDEASADYFHGTLNPDQFDAGVRQSVRRLANGLEAGTQFVAALLAIWTLGSAWDEMRKKPGLKTTLGFAGGIATLTGVTLEGAEVALRNTTWGSSKLAKPLMRTTFNLTTRASVLSFAGRALGAAASVVSGVLAIWEGVEAFGLDRTYGVTMILLGAGMVLAGILIFVASTSPVGFVLSLVIALIMFVVGFLKPDDIDKWLDKTIGFGNGEKGVFASLQEQMKAMEAIGRDDDTQAEVG